MKKKIITFLFLFFICLVHGELGNVADISEKNDTLKIKTKNSKIIKVIPVQENIFNIKIMPERATDTMSLVMDDYKKSGAAKLITDQVSEFQSDELSLKIKKSPLQLSLSAGKNQKIFNELNISENKYSFFVNQNEFYGLHNRSEGNLKNKSGGKIYAGEQGSAGAPFIWTPAGWGMIIDTKSGNLKLNDKKITYSAPKNQEILNIYLIKGGPFKIFSGMTYLTGQPPMFRKYTYGFMNTEWGMNQQELYQDVNKYRNLDIPIDAYVLDYDWMAYGEDDYGEFRWDESKFPDAVNGTMQDSLEKLGLKLMGIRKPRIHVNTVQGEYCKNHDFFYDTEIDYFTEEEVGRLDFQKKAVRKWYGNAFWKHNSYEKGPIGFWNDEADYYGGPLMFLQMQRATYNAQRKNIDKRVWSINRNYFLGCQRYAYAHWSGDIETGFKTMANQRLHMLSSIALGSTWWANDIGGFKDTPSNKNYIRWMQFGAFVPVYRVHGTQNEEREPWNYGEKAVQIARDYINLRYSLIPYIYSEAWKNHKTGRPLVRPLVMDYPEDKNVRNMSSEWHFGDNILVKPIVKKDRKQTSVYLPEGKWVDFHTGERYSGSKYVKIKTGLNDIPIFVKAGSIIPRVEPGDYVNAPISKESIYWHVYPGESSTYNLYQDDGKTYDYEKGEYNIIQANQYSTSDKLAFTTEKIKHGYNTSVRKNYIVFHNINKSPQMVKLNGKQLREVSSLYSKDISTGWIYNGSEVKIKIGKKEQEYKVEVTK